MTKHDKPTGLAAKKRNLVSAVKAKATRTLSDDDISVRRIQPGLAGITRRIADGDMRDLVIQVDDDPWDGYSRHDMDANDEIQTVDIDPGDPA